MGLCSSKDDATAGRAPSTGLAKASTHSDKVDTSQDMPAAQHLNEPKSTARLTLDTSSSTTITTTAAHLAHLPMPLPSPMSAVVAAAPVDTHEVETYALSPRCAGHGFNHDPQGSKASGLGPNRHLITTTNSAPAAGALAHRRTSESAGHQARVNQYTLHDVLGHGSQSVVRLAIDLEGHHWAMKIVKKRAVLRRRRPGDNTDNNRSGGGGAVGGGGKYGSASGRVAREIAIM
jgi:hypothetical protein